MLGDHSYVYGAIPPEAVPPRLAIPPTQITVSKPEFATNVHCADDVFIDKIDKMKKIQKTLNKMGEISD